MYKQNYKSDIKFVMRRYKCVAGKEELTPVPWPEDIDWRVLLKTPHSAKSYEASCRGGVMRNCAKTEDGGILIVMDKHGLSPGELHYEFLFELPDPLMTSGIADLYKPGSTGIMLTTDATCECGGIIDVAIVADIYKGEPFRYSDFTAEQLADLRKPAVEAATAAAKAVETLENTVDAAEDLRTKAEKARETAETQRDAAEKKRAADEDTRDANETAREKSFEDAHSRAVAAIKAANEAIAAANKATQLANDAAELCATKMAQFEAIGREILSHQYLTLEN